MHLTDESAVATATTRRTIVKTGAKLAYAAPLVAATMKLGAGAALALSSPCECAQGSSWNQREGLIRGDWDWATNRAEWGNGDHADIAFSCAGRTVTIVRSNSRSGVNGIYTGTFSDDCSSVTGMMPWGNGTWSATVNP